MVNERAKNRLASGEAVTGHFWLPEVEGEVVAGVLRWSPEDGAALETIGEAKGWPHEIGEPGFTVWGVTDKENARLTLSDAWAKTVDPFAGQVRAVRSSTLLLGEHTTATKEWPRAYFSTANLTEWRADTGLTFSHPNLGEQPRHLRMDWQPPAADQVALPDAEIVFSGGSDALWTRGPGFTITTSQSMVVDPSAPLPANDLLRRFGAPLLALTSFAADKPDGFTTEAYFDRETEERVEVWRQGRGVEQPREWHPARCCLFDAADLPDFSKSVAKWWELHKAVWPALDLFAEHLSYGNSYSPARLLTLHTALEAYARGRHGHKDFRKLRGFAGVPNAVTGCTNPALALLGASRDYFSHLSHAGQKYTLRDVQEGAVFSTRRASALMQACLLRELGLDPSDIERLLTKHYANWPLR